MNLTIEEKQEVKQIKNQKKKQRKDTPAKLRTSSNAQKTSNQELKTSGWSKNT